MILDRNTTVVYAILAAFGTAMMYSLYRGDFLLLTAGLIFFIALVAGFIYPQIFLLLYAVLIPFEDVIQISGIGTLSRGIGLLFALCYVIARFRDIRFNAVPLSIWLWFGWTAFSMLWAFVPTIAWKTVFLMTQQLVMLLLIANSVRQYPKMAAAILWMYTAAAAITGAIATQHFMAQAMQGPGRVQAFENQDEAHFAAICVPALLFCIHQLIGGNRSRLRLAAVLSMLLILAIAVLMSGTRSAWIAVIVSLAVILLPQMNARKLIVFALGFGLLGVLAARVPNLFEFIGTRASDAVSSGGSGRTAIWQVGFTNFQEHPLFGVGIGNFPKTFNWDLIQKTFMSSGGITHMEEGRAPHNIYLGTLVETGIIGLLLLLAVFRKALDTGRAMHKEGLLIKAIILSYMVQGFFLDMLKRKYLWLAIALSIGLQYAAEAARKSREEENRSVESECTLAHPDLSQPNGPGRRNFS